MKNLYFSLAFHQRTMMHQLGIVCFSFFVKFILVSADKNLILSKGSTSTRFSFDFASVMRESLNSSKCTNVYLLDRSDGIEDIFAEFVNVYPYDYTLNCKMYSCKGYLLISKSGESIIEELHSVPTSIPTIELLIIIDDHVEESAEIFDISIYGNAQVNIFTRNGLWKLSENFLHPRKFKIVTRYNDIKKNHEQTPNLQGRKLQAATTYIPPMSYLNSTFNKTVNGFEEEFFVSTDESELDGIEIKLFLIIAERLNFTWAIRRANNNLRYSKANQSTWYSGISGRLIRKEIDIAFTGIWLKLDQYLSTNLSKPWTTLPIHFLVPRPKPSTSFWALTRPLSPEVWWAIITVLIVQSVYVYIRAWINPRLPTKFRSFVTTSTELMARLLGTSSIRKIRGLKLELQLWHFMGILLVTAYSSSLAASLAKSSYEPRIDTVRQFIEANLTWGREGPTPQFDDYFGNADPWAMQFPSHFEHEENEAERHAKIVKGNYAIVGQLVGSMFFPENTIRDDDIKGYRLMKDSVAQFYTSFAVQPWLLDPVDKIIMRLSETGIIQYHLRDVIRRRLTSALESTLIEEDGAANGPKVLQITPLGAGFSMLALGLLLSTIVFCYEIKSVSRGKSFIEVFRDINKKRKTSKFRKFNRSRQ